MRHISRNISCILVAIVLFSACSSPIPDHARYIPKEAVATAGINLKSFSKKIAWNVITGSKLYKEMQDRIPEKNTKEAMSGIEKAGIDFINTVYVYVKTDNRFAGGNQITGIVPLSDAGAWEAYVKKVFPQATISDHNGRKEASLGRDLYIGWNKKVLILTSVIQDNEESTAKANDNAAMSVEMEKAFAVGNENSIKGNKHFVDLELEGHDISFMLNYDQLMNQMNGNMAEKMGLNIQAQMFKDAAFTSGFDFVKGKITGDMHYFVPGMKDIGAELGSTNVDKEMLDRLPAQNLDLLMGMHISPKGIKAILEKLSLLGAANIALTSQNLNVDNVLSAFTGDMAIVMNDFSIQTEKVTDNFMGQTVVHENQKPAVSVTYVMKLNKKEEFQKLVKLAKESGLPPSGNGFVIPINAKDSVYILMNDQYAVASNRLKNASNIINGAANGNKMPAAAAAQVYGHPTAFYMDVQEFLKNIDPAISHSAHDSLMIAESKHLINNLSFVGGGFKNDAFEYHLDINFINTEENSIINLMDFGMKMSEAGKLANK